MKLLIFILIIASWVMQGIMPVVPQEYLIVASFANGVFFGALINILWWRF